MTRLNPFRVSFDGPLGSRERKRARVTATLVGGAGIILGVTSLLALLNLSSEAIGTWSNATPEPAVRILASEGEAPAGKACEEQTWPYIESRCLKPADPDAPGPSTLKPGLNSQQVALPNVLGADASPSPVNNAAEPSTTGSAASASQPDAARAKEPEPIQTVAVPLPVPAPAPDAAAASDAPRRALQSDAAEQRHDATPRLSKREQRRLQREERKRLLSERREEARILRKERVRARAMARNESRRGGGDRIVRRWTEYTYPSESGGSRRVIVIRRGSLDDDFFRTIR